MGLQQPCLSVLHWFVQKQTPRIYGTVSEVFPGYMAQGREGSTLQQISTEVILAEFLRDIATDSACLPSELSQRGGAGIPWGHKSARSHAREAQVLVDSGSSTAGLAKALRTWEDGQYHMTP